MMTETIPIDAQSHAVLRRLSETSGEPVAEVLAKAVEAYRRETFLRGLNDDFAQLRRDEPAWQDEKAERQAWEGTVGDDLADD